MVKVSIRKTVPAAALLTCALTLLVGCATPHADDALSVDELLTRSDALDGSPVSVAGYLVLDFEDHNLYASRKDAMEKVHNDQRCVALSLPEEVFSEWKGKANSRVRVSGILKKNYCGEDEFCPYACNRVGLEEVRISR